MAEQLSGIPHQKFHIKCTLADADHSGAFSCGILHMRDQVSVEAGMVGLLLDCQLIGTLSRT